MKPFFGLVALSSIFLFAQAGKNPFMGRWDITITSANGNTSPRWMEVAETGGNLQIRIQPSGGAVRPAVASKMDGSKLVITVNAAGRGPETTWELTPDGDRFTGVQKTGENTAQIAGVRAPELKRAPPKAWSEPEALFNGKDLTGWEPFGRGQNKWLARDGELVNDNSGGGGANLKTTRKFDDFKLHIELICPEHGNSGIYLRGRYEIQVGTEGGTRPAHEMGAVYGFFAPLKQMPMSAGEWQTFDITLVGRTLTALRNGVLIHDNLELAGITGGALDSNEAEPGPFFLQGDHQGVLRFRNIKVSVPKR
jgi:hypothetical protein